LRTLADVLFTQGFGSRRGVRRLVLEGAVSVAGVVSTDPELALETEGLVFGVKGEEFLFRDKVLVAMNKPAGFECSQKPSHHPSVFSLLPAYLVARGVQCVGRLDEDTTGLLLFTDDGALNHALSHPKRRVPKTYLAGLAHAVDEAFAARLQGGVLLHGEDKPVRALGAERLSDKRVRIDLDSGSYHIVKRMIAAAGNRCVSLTRTAVGRLELDENLAPGAWKYVSPDDIWA